MSERIPCEGCIYRHPGDHNAMSPALDECRRYPPTVVLRKKNEPWSLFPMAFAKCGEFKTAGE